MRLNNYGYKDSGNYNCYNNLSPVAVLITLLRLILQSGRSSGFVRILWFCSMIFLIAALQCYFGILSCTLLYFKYVLDVTRNMDGHPLS